MNILYLYADRPKEWNCSEWRCRIPTDAFNRTKEHAARMVFIADWAAGKHNADCAWADTIILQRECFAEELALVCHWRGQGKRVYIDLDDAYEIMPPSVPAHQFWRAGMGYQIIQKKGANVAAIWSRTDDEGHTYRKPTKLPFEPLEHWKMGMKLCDGITTPSLVIQQDMLPYGPSYLVPNYPSVKHYTEAEPMLEKSEILNIGWAGGGSHWDSFVGSGVLTALERVVNEREHVQACIIGPQDVFMKMRGVKKKIYIPWGPYAEYPSKLKCLDIGLAPLCGQYDRRRSWLKGLEYSLIGIPWLATDYQVRPQPYDFFGREHMVVNSSKNWERAILDIIDHYEDYKTQALEERHIAEEQDIDDNLQILVDVYSGKSEQEQIVCDQN